MARLLRGTVWIMSPRGHERDMVRACVCRERSSEHRLHWQAASVGDAEGTRRSTLGVPDVYY